MRTAFALRRMQTQEKQTALRNKFDALALADRTRHLLADLDAAPMLPGFRRLAQAERRALITTAINTLVSAGYSRKEAESLIQ